MRTKIALERAKILEKWLAMLRDGGKVILDPTDVPFLEEIKKQDDKVIRQYPNIVKRRRKTRQDTFEDPHWRQINDAITEPLLGEVKDYLKQLNKIQKK